MVGHHRVEELIALHGTVEVVQDTLQFSFGLRGAAGNEN